ncbi:MAG: sigma-70 family RNA polymerase sigma factor [Actinomycetota bacterium]
MTDPLDPRFAEYARSRDPAVRDALVLDNQGLAIAFARRYRDRGVPDDDLRQIAFESLIRSVERFDPDRGVRFSTFAVRRIEGELKQYFRDRTWDVHVPRRARELSTTVQSAIATLTQELGRSPTPRDIADHLGMDLADVTLALDAAGAYRSGSLDAEGRIDPSVGPAEDDVDASMTVRTLLATLPDADREIVTLRFFGGLSQSQIADRVGVSQMQISRVLRRALANLREELDLDEI